MRHSCFDPVFKGNDVFQDKQLGSSVCRFHPLETLFKAGVVAYTYNHSTRKIEAEGSSIPAQQGLQKETPAQNKPMQKGTWSLLSDDANIYETRLY